MPPFKKGEKITDQAVLDRLAAARGKALEVRKAKSKARADEKLLADLLSKKQEAEVKEQLEELTNPTITKTYDKKKSQKKQPEPESNPESDSEPEQEEIIVKKKKKKPKKKVIYVQESDDESVQEDEEAYRAPSTVEPSKSIEPQPDPRKIEIERMYQAVYGRRKLRT